MKIQKLSLRNFRNIQSCHFYPSPRLNFLFGKNGQGKTSFLETVSLLSSLRSFRGVKADDLIRWNESFSEIHGELLSEDENHKQESSSWGMDLRVLFQKETEGRTVKTAFINQKLVRNSAQYIRSCFGPSRLGFHTISFNPSDHDLVKGEPAIRRSYLDRLLSAEDLAYFEELQKYQRTLQQRNELLKIQGNARSKELSAYSEALCKHGCKLVYFRLQWVERLNSRLPFFLQKIAPEHPLINVKYCSKWVREGQNLSFDNNNLNSNHLSGQLTHPSIKQLETVFRLQLVALEQAELNCGVSLVGPHRDDWVFYLNDHALKGCGSQGEVRSVLLALKLTEIDLFQERTGRRPLFLLDDFSSELDKDRRRFLLDFLSGTDLQIFVTSTEEIVTQGKCYWVNDGSLFEIKGPTQGKELLGAEGSQEYR